MIKETQAEKCQGYT